MPPKERPRILNLQRSAHNPIINNTPPPNIMYPIVSHTTTASIVPVIPPEITDKNERKINNSKKTICSDKKIFHSSKKSICSDKKTICCCEKTVCSSKKSFYSLTEIPHC